MSEAGWYPNPQDPRTVRYFDGRQWTEHVQVLNPRAAAGTAAGAAAQGSVTGALNAGDSDTRADLAHGRGARDRRLLAGRDDAVPTDRTAANAVSPAEQQTTQYQPVEQPTTQYPPAQQLGYG